MQFPTETVYIFIVSVSPYTPRHLTFLSTCLLTYLCLFVAGPVTKQPVTRGQWRASRDAWCSGSPAESWAFEFECDTHAVIEHYSIYLSVGSVQLATAVSVQSLNTPAWLLDCQTEGPRFNAINRQAWHLLHLLFDNVATSEQCVTAVENCRCKVPGVARKKWPGMSAGSTTWCCPAVRLFVDIYIFITKAICCKTKDALFNV